MSVKCWIAARWFSSFVGLRSGPTLIGEKRLKRVRFVGSVPCVIQFDECFAGPLGGGMLGAVQGALHRQGARSEERRVGKEC